MAASWLTIAAPYVPEIIRLAKPLFTRKPPQVDESQQQRLELIESQIAELQSAATTNADSISKLASDMQKTLEILQVGAERAEQQVRGAQALAWVAVTAAVLAFALAAYALAS